ncbi:class E basic helix-loop-helix protein 41 [Dryobates pubescens]|uniref:class E basic helix-loop-helix protein 41 n=1 Tax=Dryobates pubescens TaxID=118200 RepID=UPI0023B95269|nr:class E basic helix-loop-helix protein 41 [Dryobates pubescens]
MCGNVGSPQERAEHPGEAEAGDGKRAEMDEGISRLPERQLLEHRDFIGLDYPSLYMCKPKRGVKRDDSKVGETYKLPHRLIEKKRRDRINECIAQLKDLLPEHLKLTTLGHLEKAVVLELTLKHLKALTALTEQQHQKIIALQNGERSMKSPVQADLDAFHSGFQTCAKEVLQYLSRCESGAPREQRCAQLLGHLHSVSAQLLPGPPLLAPPGPLSKASSCSPPCAPGHRPEGQANCVPVIQRTHAEPSAETDTDTDSGYGGEAEARPERGPAAAGGALPALSIKQEPSADEVPPAPKRLKLDRGGSPLPGVPGLTARGAEAAAAAAALVRPDAALLGSLMALGGGGGPFGQPAAPFCLPFYFISPSAAAYMQPLLDKGGLEKYLYPAAPIPLLYPSIPAQAAAAAAAAAAASFPCLSSVLGPADKAAAAGLPPAPHLPHPFATAAEPAEDPEPSAAEQPGAEGP